MTENILYEIDRRSITITKIEESIIAWQKNVLSVRNDKGIQLYEFSHNLESLYKNIDCSEIHIPVTKRSPAEKLFCGKVFDRYTPNTLFTDMLLEPAMWAHNQNMLDDLANVSNFLWSPVGFVQNNQCALAILNNVGHVDIFACKESKWINIFSLSPYLSLYLTKESSMKPERLKNEVYKASTCAMAWSPTLTPNRTCILVTAQKDCSMYFWRLQNIDFDIKATKIGETKCEYFELNSILWITKTEREFCLICSDITGEVTALEFSMENNSVVYKNQNNLWLHKDKMVPYNLNYFMINNKYVLIYSKHRYLIVQLLDENLKNLGQYVKNVNDYRIKNITSTIDGFYLSTSNCEIFKINIDIHRNVDVTLVKQETKDKDLATSFDMLGVVFSPNKMIFAVVMVNKQIYYRKLKNRIEISFMTTEKTMDSICSVLFNNPTESLHDYWDCIHLLRYRSMKLKQMPSADYNQLYEDAQINIYKMKLYLIFLIIHNRLKSTINIILDPPLSETSVDIIKDKILLYHATGTMKNLYEIHKKSGVTEFQMECFRGCKMFIEDYCQRTELNITTVLGQELLSFTQTVDSICQCCDEKLDKFSCKEGHLNMFCSLTFTQINSDEYLVCNACDATARQELYSIDPMCVFCDLYLQKVYGNT